MIEISQIVFGDKSSRNCVNSRIYFELDGGGQGGFPHPDVLRLRDHPSGHVDRVCPELVLEIFVVTNLHPQTETVQMEIEKNLSIEYL